MINRWTFPSLCGITPWSSLENESYSLCLPLISSPFGRWSYSPESYSAKDVLLNIGVIPPFGLGFSTCRTTCGQYPPDNSKSLISSQCVCKYGFKSSTVILSIPDLPLLLTTRLYALVMFFWLTIWSNNPSSLRSLHPDLLGLYAVLITALSVSDQYLIISHALLLALFYYSSW